MQKSSEDDVPLRKLINNKPKAIPTKQQTTDADNVSSDDDDELPVSKLVEKKISSIHSSNANSKSVVSSSSIREDRKIATTEASDSEDDLPISEMIKKRKREGRLDHILKKIQNNKDNKKIKNTSSSNSSSSKPQKADIKESYGISSNSKEFYENTEKGKLIQTLLVRWWYAIEWPKGEDIEEPPGGYEPLDGFLGVFVSTSTDSLGEILDLRDKSTCPCLSNYAKKPSAEIKELCTVAIEAQMKALIAAEGEKNCRVLLDTLKTNLAEIKKINTDKADRESREYSNFFN